jgi:protein-L-isoaspartate(D-aspartate) O-methyltransferase
MPGRPFDEDELAIVRRAFARQMMTIGGVQDERLEQVFATIRRERFLGPAPWQIVRWPPDRHC